MRIFDRLRKPRAGDMFTWLSGGALAMCVLLVIMLMAILAWNGLGYFWQKPVHRIVLDDGSIFLGEIHDRHEIDEGEGPTGRFQIRMKLGNRDLTGSDFRWFDEEHIVQRSIPVEAMLLERTEYGNFYGYPVELRRDGELLLQGADRVRSTLPALHRKKMELLQDIHDLETGAIGDVNYEIEERTRELKKIELAGGDAVRSKRIQDQIDARNRAYRQLAEQLSVFREELLRETLVMEAADGTRQEVPVGSIVRAIRPNDLDIGTAIGLYFSRVREFLLDDPREANTEGGIFPAIFGTVMMVFIMVFAVTPLGVLAAVYMREYARQGWVIRAIRIAVNNLAGVPSIVFGVFGLGFFVYLVGGSIDKLFYPENLPAPTFGTGGILWGSLTLALLTVPVVIVATEEGLAAVPRSTREGSLALGATKFETTWKVVVPASAPGILTGVILAMARAAGEVAPLMIVGMVKLAPSLPLDHHFPFVHLERKFMHLGFHIYDVGFQSPNVEATKPLVFATALLLVVIVALMNLLATWVRNRLRRKYASSAV